MLAGNPNSGKTTLFNFLTGNRQRVGNYPGVTVEKREGQVHHNGYDITVTDLPGTYSLSAQSPDEVVARQVMLDESPDLIVNVVDASNLQRNLYLTVQLLELKIPLILVLNMIDEAETEGISIDDGVLEQLLGVKVVRTIGRRRQGIEELMDAITNRAGMSLESASRPGVPVQENRVSYNYEIEEELEKVCYAIEKERHLLQGHNAAYPVRWLALKLLESDPLVKKQLLESGLKAAVHQGERSRAHLMLTNDEDAESMLTEGRYAVIRGVLKESVTLAAAPVENITDRLDRVLLHRYWGFPILVLVMWLLFEITFSLGQPVMDLMDSMLVALEGWLAARMDDGLLESLVVDGVIGGVGGVLVFLPLIIILFAGIALLEDSGYMARAAFLMDWIMHNAGLHGKSFIPMMIGFGCSVPAVLATRILENRRDRLATMLVVPLISCGARLPVYTLLIAAFFPGSMAGTVLFSVYLIGVIMAVLMARIFRATIFAGPSDPFVMELPAYRMPVPQSIAIHAWERAWMYIKKAGTIILASAIIVWALFAFALPGASSEGYLATSMEESVAAGLGQGMEPVLRPLGFDWKTGIALIAGLGAKEMIASTMGTLYSLESENAIEGDDEERGFAQRAREASGFTPLGAYSLMLFVLLYSPCAATLAVLARESQSLRWPAFALAYSLVLAWLVSFAVYQLGSLAGLG